MAHMSPESDPPIDEQSVTRWLSERTEVTEPLTFDLIAGGRSNMTYTVRDAAGLLHTPFWHACPVERRRPAYRCNSPLARCLQHTYLKMNTITKALAFAAVGASARCLRQR